MDVQVAAAYGWDDLALEHGYHKTAQDTRFTISEAARREVLTRLLKLNHERFAEECRQGSAQDRQKGKKACAEFFAKQPHLKIRQFTALDPLQLQLALCPLRSQDSILLMMSGNSDQERLL